MTDEPEIERCVCGETARERPYTRSVKADDHTMYRVDIYWVECPHPYPRKRCWLGPECETPEAAITAWNTLMRAAKERARLQAEVAKGHQTIMDEWGYVGREDGTELPKEDPTEEERGAWINDDDARESSYPRRRCTCPDCTEHRAREKETTT